MLLNFKMNANITIEVAKETIKELQDLFNKIKSTPETHKAYELLCESLKDGFEYGSEAHIYQYLKWVLERDLKPTIKDTMQDVTEDLALFVHNKCLFIDLQELTVNQVVTCACQPVDMKEQEDNQLCLNI